MLQNNHQVTVIREWEECLEELEDHMEIKVDSTAHFLKQDSMIKEVAINLT